MIDSRQYGSLNVTSKSSNYSKHTEESKPRNPSLVENWQKDEEDKERQSDMTSLLSLAKPERSLIGIALGAQAVSAGATVLFPMALGRIVDNVSGGAVGDLDTLMYGLGGVFTLASVATG